MAAPKIKTAELPNLYEKKIVETLRERLNDKIQKDPKLAKKAALIIEQWINKKPKSKP